MINSIRFKNSHNPVLLTKYMADEAQAFNAAFTRAF